MQTVEVVIFIVISFIVTASLLNFILNLNAREIYKDVKGLLGQKDEISLKYDKEKFLNEFFNLWEGCSYGELQKEYLVYLEGNGSISKDELSKRLAKLNLNDKLADNKIIFKRINLPYLGKVACNQNGIFLGNEYMIVIHYQDNNYIKCFIDEDDYLECETPNGETGRTKIVLRVYNGSDLIEELELDVIVADEMQIGVLSSSYITSQKPSNNFDGESFLFSGSDGNQAYRILVDFPGLTGIDPTKIAKAELALTQIIPPNAVFSGQDLNLHLTGANWEASSVTWNFPWNNQGGDFLITSYGSTNLIDYTTDQVFTKPVSITITSLVKTLIQFPVDDKIILKAKDENTANLKKFYSDNAPSSEFKPKLKLYLLD